MVFLLWDGIIQQSRGTEFLIIHEWLTWHCQAMPQNFSITILSFLCLSAFYIFLKFYPFKHYNIGSIIPRWHVGLIFHCFQLPWEWHPGAKTNTSLVIVKDCISLTSSVDWHTDDARWLLTIRENHFAASFFLYMKQQFSMALWSNKWNKMKSCKYSVLCISVKE